MFLPSVCLFRYQAHPSCWTLTVVMLQNHSLALSLHSSLRNLLSEVDPLPLLAGSASCIEKMKVKNVDLKIVCGMTVVV